MTPRAEELWSYMIGLGPVGKPVLLIPEHLSEDLNLHYRTTIANLTCELVKAGVVRRIGAYLFEVVSRDMKPLPKPTRKAKKRDEAKPAVQAHPTPKIVHVASYAVPDAAARLAEIPPDTRTPAQRLMGDPIFARSALAMRGTA